MTHHVWHDSFICETWLIHMWDMTRSYVRHDSFICENWLIHMWDMTHSYVWHDSFICVTWLIHICDMTHSFVWHDSFIRDMTHSYAWHDSLLWDMTHSYVTWLIHVCSYTTPLPLRAQALAVWLKRSNEPLTKEPKGALRGFLVQPIADRVAQNLEIISKNFQFSTRHQDSHGIYHLLRGTNRKSHGRNSGLLKRFKNNLEIQCHPICNRL